MADSMICQRCGVAVGPEGAQGLCPACLLEQGLYDSQAVTLPQEAGSGPAPESDLAKLVSQFPQLEIVELVGRGGMGVVYKARHRGLDRLVALKILPPGVDRDPGFQERFVREARALARLNHPNIVAVYDFGQAEGRYYFLMEFVDGANLRRMLQGGHLTPQEAMAIVPQLCDALQFAHEEGIVHRDIKPENILLDRKGRVKIADFGLAKLLRGSLPQDPHNLTSPRQVLGTPHYMAPEQLEKPGTVDHRADIFSMGVVFYEMLTGELPLGRFAPPSHKVQIDVRLDEVVLRTLEKEPEHRYQRAGEVKTELASLATVPSSVPPRWSAGDIGSAGPREPSPSSRPGVSPCAIGGALAAFPFPLACLMAALVAPARGGPSYGDLIVSTVAFLGIVSAVCSCALGLAGIKQIRNSNGRYRGMKLAFAAALAYPLLVFDLIVFSVMMFLMDPGGGPQADRLMMLSGVLVVVMDIWVVRRLWRNVSQRLQPRPDHDLPQRPIRPQRPSRAYSLPAKPGMAGRLIGIGVVGILLLLGVLVVVGAVIARDQRIMAMREREAAWAAEMASRSAEPAVIRLEANGDGGARDRFGFMIHSPADTKTTVWAELWSEGKPEAAPQFDVTHWVIPPAGQPFDGSASFAMEPSQDKILVRWRISGNAGGIVSDGTIPDPFFGMTVRDSTWVGRKGSPGEWRVSPGQVQQVLALRGAKQRLVGTADDPALIGHADVEVRVFVRLDPLAADEQGSRPMIGSSPRRPNDGNGPRGHPFKMPPGVHPPAGMSAPSALPLSLPPTGAEAPQTDPGLPSLGAPIVSPEPRSVAPVDTQPPSATPAPGENTPAGTPPPQVPSPGDNTPAGTPVPPEARPPGDNTPTGTETPPAPQPPSGPAKTESPSTPSAPEASGPLEPVGIGGRP